jgi:hypothetical protein
MTPLFSIRGAYFLRLVRFGGSLQSSNPGRSLYARSREFSPTIALGPHPDLIPICYDGQALGSTSRGHSSNRRRHDKKLSAKPHPTRKAKNRHQRAGVEAVQHRLGSPCWTELYCVLGGGGRHIHAPVRSTRRETITPRDTAGTRFAMEQHLRRPRVTAGCKVTQ